MTRCLVLFVVLAAILTGPAVAATDEGPAPVRGDVSAPRPVADSEARRLVSAFEARVRSARKERHDVRRREGELAALQALSAGRHDRIAKRLAAAAVDDRLLDATRVSALRGLRAQGDLGREHAKRVAKWLREEAKGTAEALEKGDIGVPVDRKTGEPITETAEAVRKLREGKANAKLHAAALAALRDLEHEPKKPEELVRPFLQSPYDELAVAAIEAAQAWRVRAVVQELALLLRMYPRGHRWETSAVTHIAGTNASAKAAWMKLFGHPLKQRARPAVHRAVTKCLSEWAGIKIEDPETCDAWLSRRKGD